MASELTFTHVNEFARKRMGITRDEYALCYYISCCCADPRQMNPGWCCDTRESLAAFVGITRQGLQKMVQKMENAGLLESCPTSEFLRATALFVEVSNAQNNL